MGESRASVTLENRDDSGGSTAAKCGTERGEMTAAVDNLPVFNSL